MTPTAWRSSARAGFGIFDEPGYNKKLRLEVERRHRSGVRAGVARPAARLQRLGVDTDADGCLRIESEDQSDDYADFLAIVCFTYVD